jgi:hypothetical protein
MTNRSILLVAAALLAPGAIGATETVHYTSWTEAKAAAAEQKKLLLLDFFSEN